jgi:polyisoprenoid-binding protein YceI
LTKNGLSLKLTCMRLPLLCFVYLLFSSALLAQSPEGVPVFEITPVHSSTKFHVKASTTIAGKFDKWDALTFSCPDETRGSLEIKIQAASVDTGSSIKNGKLKSDDFFDVERNPLITFKSTKFAQVGPDTFEVDGDFTIRGVSDPEKLTPTVSGRGTGSGEVKGVMVFSRKDYGMDKRIPFIKTADHVDVNFRLLAKLGKHVGGPMLALRSKAYTR